MILTVSCGGNAAGPNGGRPRLVHGVAVTPGDSGRLFLLDTTGTTVHRIDLQGALQYERFLGASQDPGRTTLYFTVLYPDFRRELVAVGLPDGAIHWREPLSSTVATRLISGVEVHAAEQHIVSHDGSAILFDYAKDDAVVGVAKLDLATRSIASFAGPLEAHGGMAELAPGARFPRGAFVIGAARVPGGPRGVYFLDTESLAVLDSLPAHLFENDQPAGIVAAPGDTVLYLSGRQRVRRYDLVSGRVTASAPKAINGGLFLTGDSKALVHTDPGEWPDSPGSGRLTVFDAATLDVVRTIELPRADGVPRVSLNAVPGQSPGRMYVTTGTAARGTLFGVQPAMLFEVDVNRGTLVRAVHLHDWGAAIPSTF